VVYTFSWFSWIGSLHITPLKGIVQLKPNLSYLDRADVGAKKLEAAASDDGGDTTESEGEEAKPVTVRLAKPVNPAKSQKKVGHKQTFSESSNVPLSWTTVEYHGVESEEADEERKLLFAEDDDQSHRFSMPEKKYLDSIFPKEACRQVDRGDGSSGQPIGVVSLESIRKHPLKRQVCGAVCAHT
jgi:DNA-directed RNA polymerase-3 subunit RPC5